MLYNLLDASAVWAGIGSVLLAVLILLVMVTVHEFGHYIAGKILKFKINEFSVGFGPVLFQRVSKKTGEKFSLRLIPLGGYCAFEDEDGLQAEGEKEAGMPENIPVEEVFTDESLRPVDTPAGNTGAGERPQASGEKTASDKAASGKFCDQAPWKRIIVLVSGALMNYLLALLLIFISFFAFGQLMLMPYRVEASETIAAEYSLQDRDIILSADGKQVYMTTDLMNAVKDRQEGEEIVFRVSRVVDAETGAREEREVVVRLRRATDFENSADTDRLWEALGVAKQTDDEGNVLTDSNGNPNYLIYSTPYRFGFFQTIGNAFMYSVRIAGAIFQVLGELLMGALGVDAFGGPITTIAVTSQIASRGLQPFLEIAAYIGVNLAVFNLLPVPALDGSKVVFTAIEWVRGKPINRKVEAIIHAVGFLLILGFAVLVDVLQFL